MKLDEIGFYTLTDKRAKEATWTSDLQRCELILTDRCNFKCAYCRGIKKEFQGDLSLEEAKHVVKLWADNNLHNIRFSGGEPTVWKDLLELVEYTKTFSCYEHIALSTNGSASIEYYELLHKVGVNDFSISLDACCSMTADLMAGTNSKFDHICEVIKYLSVKTYVTVGVVLDNRNNEELIKIIDHASSLGVSDIRVIPSAQSNHLLNFDVKTHYKILSYRLNRIKNGQHIRGITESDCHKCHLVKDDMVILKNSHFPCIIYMREQGNEIGSIKNKTIEQIREERKMWFNNHNSFNDPICKKNCLDFCIEYNNKVSENEGLSK